MAETIWNTVVMVFHFIMKNIVIINILLSLIIVFFERRSPQAVWTWLLLLYFYSDCRIYSISDHRAGLSQEIRCLRQGD